MTEIKKIGILQSRGGGDIVIALPIARYYYDAGYEVYWPICEEFVSSFIDSAPWVQWIPVVTDAKGAFFYDTPMQKLAEVGVTEIIPLYQALTGHPEFSDEPYFNRTKFDEYKYAAAGVPFLHKWQLRESICRNKARELELYNRLVTNPNYVVIHREGSDFTANVDLSIIPEGWQTIEITAATDCMFDWLSILEGAQSLIMVDSVFANIVDQMGIGTDRYFIPRSHIGLTPVHGHVWTYL